MRWGHVWFEPDILIYFLAPANKHCIVSIDLSRKMDPKGEQPPTLSTSQISLLPPYPWQQNIDLQPSEFVSDNAFSSCKPKALTQPEQHTPVNSQASIQANPTRKRARERAPKTETISAKRWRPCEPLIKRLYVHDGLSAAESLKTINKEFGLEAK